jgi:hypothetical protein
MLPPEITQSAMGYYVGTWTCVAGPIGKPQANATATYVMNGSILNESVSVPAQNSMKGPYSLSFAISYDGTGRYIQTMLDNYGSWGVSYAPPWTGNTEQWTDLTTSVVGDIEVASRVERKAEREAET